MSNKIYAERYHDISCGHRVVNHESKCRHLHGHNYRIHFRVAAPLDSIGRVMDFSVIKEKLCMWLEYQWDHKMLLWERDPLLIHTGSIYQDGAGLEIFTQSVVVVPFNPTAENMAQYLVEVVGPNCLEGTGVTLVEVRIEETRKCSAIFTKVI